MSDNAAYARDLGRHIEDKARLQEEIDDLRASLRTVLGYCGPLVARLQIPITVMAEARRLAKEGRE